MKNLLPFATLLLTLFADPAIAQTVPSPPDLPSTPAPAAPALPPLLHPASHAHGQDAPVEPSDEDHTRPLNCIAPSSSSGTEAYRVPAKLTAAQQRDLERYFFLLVHKVREIWFRSMPLLAQAGPFQKKGDVGIQFTILANGALATTPNPPLLTVSSGRASFDKHAMDSLRAAAPFLPLPTGGPEKIEVCMFFLYNEHPPQQKKPIDLWPPPPPPSPQTAPQSNPSP